MKALLAKRSDVAYWHPHLLGILAGKKLSLPKEATLLTGILICWGNKIKGKSPDSLCGSSGFWVLTGGNFGDAADPRSEKSHILTEL
ncbi:hypothetical protein QUA35_20315 [Microcoleus sp. N9_B2]|uniref:hypothetical protein n=1 Tax=unclassified Microcoleus TaxID=2642155 RepID=UPI002FCFA603